MWGRWYLPMFLFRDGLLTLIYRASLMALMRFCSSLPTMLKFSKETWWPVVVKWSKIGGGGLEMFFEPLSKCSWWFTYIFIITLHPVAFKSVDDSTCVFYRILICWSHQEAFDCSTSFEVDLHPMVCTSFLEAFTEPSLVWNNDVWLLVGVSSRVILVVIVPSVGWCWILYVCRQAGIVSM